MQRSLASGCVAVVAAWLCAAGLVVSANAQAGPPTVELFFRPPEIIQAQLSPSGRRLTISTTLAGERVGLFVWDLGDSADAARAGRARKVTRAAQYSDFERDRRVPMAHGERLRRAMREAGNEPLWVSYGGEGHSGLKRETHLDFAQRVDACLAEHLAPEPPPPR